MAVFRVGMANADIITGYSRLYFANHYRFADRICMLKPI